LADEVSDDVAFVEFAAVLCTFQVGQLRVVVCDY